MPTRAAAGNGKPLYWYDPMIPNQHFDKPGKSPMGMEMVPKYTDEESESGGVRVSSGVVQNLGIRLGKVEKASLKSGLHAVGSVAFDDRLVEVVQARVEGYVTHLNAKAPLEHVRRGQPLAAILAPQWLEAQQEYLALVDARSQSAERFEMQPGSAWSCSVCPTRLLGLWRRGTKPTPRRPWWLPSTVW